MFKFLKEKLKQGISKFSKKIEEEGKEEVVEKPVEAQEIKETSTVKEPIKEEKKQDIPAQAVEENKEEIEKEDEEEIEKLKEVIGKKQEEPKKGFFHRIKESFSKKDVIEEKEEELKEEGYKEVKVKHELDELKEKEEKKKHEEELKKKDKVIKEKIQKKEIPTLQQLKERKTEEEKIKEIERPKVEERAEVKEKPKKAEPAKVEEMIEKVEEEGQKPFEETEEIPQKKGFFGALKEKITTKKINEDQFESLFWDMEVALLENNVAVEVIDKIKTDLKTNLVDKPILRSRIESTIESVLKKSIEDVLNVPSFDLLKKLKDKKPYVICFVGINGSGKTTTIAKITKLMLNNKLSCVIAAADTFRAAAIDQLQIHADKLGVKLIKQDYGSDPAAVAFDAIKHAQSKNIDVVLIDTAGRMHSNTNLTDEMKKIVRVAKPDLKIFVGESITGNDCVEQAKTFNEAIGIDAIILSKADVDEKGGAAVSVSYVTEKPIIYIGTGQNYEDLSKFDSKVVLNSLGLA